MSRIKRKIESLFEDMGRYLYRNKIKSMIALLLFVGSLISQMPGMTLDTSSEALLREGDTSRLDYDKFRQQFGKSELIIITINSPDIFETPFLNKLKAFHTDLENEVPYVREVTSLINARNTRGEGDTLIVEDLLENWPEKQVESSVLKKQVLNNPTYVDYIVSKDSVYAAVIVESEAIINEDYSQGDFLNEFDAEVTPSEDTKNSPPDQPRYFSEQENTEVVKAVNQIMDRYRAPDFSMALSGGPVITDVFNHSTLRDMKWCMSIAFFINAFFLSILFRRISGIILPLFIVYMALFSTFGLMAIFDVPFKLTTVVIPGFLISVGVANSVHILAIFYRRIDVGESREDAISYALGHSGLAIVMTSLTTAAGLLSFSFAELAAIAEMGIFAAAGVILALIYTIIMLPPLFAFIPMKPKKKKREGTHNYMDRVLLAVADFSTSHSGKIILVSLSLLILSSIFVFKLRFSNNIVDYFPESMTVKKDLSVIDKALQGVVTLEIVVDTKKENGIHEPELLNRIETLSQKLVKYKTEKIFVGKVFSINDIIKEINQALHANNPEYYTLPDDRQTIAQELLLFENSGSDDLERIVDSQFSKTRITVKTPWVDSVVFRDFIVETKDMAQQVFLDKGDICLTGVVVLMARTIPAALHSMTKSYGIAFVVITLMMILLVSDIKIGLLSMIPNFLPILLIMGIMGFANIPLNLNTLMIGSIAIGLVVDDTVHYIYNFQRYFEATGDSCQSVRETMLGTGRALLITSLVLASGFFTLMTCSLNNFVVFGFYTGLVVVVALLADFLLAPALLMMVTRKKSLGI